MKFLILISLLSIGILEASGQSSRAYGNPQHSQDHNPFTVIVNGVPITIPQRSGSPNIRNSFSSSNQRIEDDSEVINADEQVFAESRASESGSSNISNKLLRKVLQTVGLNIQTQPGNNDLLTQVIANQITSFAQTLAQTIRDRLQNLRPQAQRQQDDNPEIEVESQLTALEILYQFFTRPQLLLQLLPQLIPQNSAENRQTPDGFASPSFAYPRAEFHRNFTKDGSGWHKGSGPGFRASPLGRTFWKLASKQTTTTTTTTTSRPVTLPQQSKGARIVNRLLSKVGLGTTGAGGSIGSIDSSASASTASSVDTGTGGDKISRFFNKRAGPSASGSAGGSAGASASASAGGSVGTGTGGGKISRLFNKGADSSASSSTDSSASATISTGSGTSTVTGGGIGGKVSRLLNTITGTGSGPSGKSFNLLNVGK